MLLLTVHLLTVLRASVRATPTARSDCPKDARGLPDPGLAVAFATLLLLEIVLGIDNVVFISILAAKLPAHQQKRARQIGLLLALVTRIVLLFSLSWIIGLTAPWFTVLEQEISGRDLILILGGLKGPTTPGRPSRSTGRRDDGRARRRTDARLGHLRPVSAGRPLRPRLGGALRACSSAGTGPRSRRRVPVLAGSPEATSDVADSRPPYKITKR